MKCLVAHIVVGLLLCVHGTVAQDQAGPQQPIVLEHADSLVGRGDVQDEERAFMGHVRFRQGNVTVQAERAVQSIAANRVDLSGRVRITQGTITIEAPSVRYDASTHQAVALGGVLVRDGARTITAATARYSARTHVANFTGHVAMVDDSIRMLCDTLQYHRDDKQSTAWGNVRLADTAGTAWMRGDTVENDPQSGRAIVRGNAQAWRTYGNDTVYIGADVLRAQTGSEESYAGTGHVRLVRQRMASRADSMHYHLPTGVVALVTNPVVWSDSTMLVADSMRIHLPDGALRSIVGRGQAFMASKSDTLLADRVDQLRGDEIVFLVEQDTLRNVQAIGNTQSLYFGSEAGKPNGLAQFASDTTRIMFYQGSPEDIVWLGGIRGEHHPESIVAGKAATYRLPGYRWRTDRPVRPMPPTDPFLRSGSM